MFVHSFCFLFCPPAASGEFFLKAPSSKTDFSPYIFLLIVKSSYPFISSPLRFCRRHGKASVCQISLETKERKGRVFFICFNLRPRFNRGPFARKKIVFVHSVCFLFCPCQLQLAGFFLFERGYNFKVFHSKKKGSWLPLTLIKSL